MQLIEIILLALGLSFFSGEFEGSFSESENRVSLPVDSDVEGSNRLGERFSTR
jgi:hypothetical protein